MGCWQRAAASVPRKRLRAEKVWANARSLPVRVYPPSINTNISHCINRAKNASIIDTQTKECGVGRGGRMNKHANAMFAARIYAYMGSYMHIWAHIWAHVGPN